MRLSMMCGLAVVGSLFLAATVMAQPAGGPGGPGGMRGMRGMGMQQDPLQQALDEIGLANLRPDFELTKDQKAKIQAIRTEAKNATDKWQKDHAAELQKLQSDMQTAMQDQDQEKMREVMTKRRELTQTAPQTEEAAKQVKAVLTPDQTKTLEAVVAERQEEQRARQSMMGGGMRGMRGGAGGFGGGPGGGN